jgi:hypothetical protein
VITDLVLGVVLGAVRWLLGFLPEGDPIGLASVSGIWYGYAWLNSWLPLNEILAGFAVWLGFTVLVYAYLGIKTVRHWVLP